jgi:pectate lyase
MQVSGWCLPFRHLKRPIVGVLAAGFLVLFIASAEAPGRNACDLPTMECPAVAELLAQREGYGRAATGGLGGKFVVVTSNADSGRGTLRDFVEHARGPLWVTFAADMAIDLHSQIGVRPNITIDGRGRAVTLHDWGLTLAGTYDVIVTHIAIDGRFRQESQAVNIAPAHDVWLDHLTLSRSQDRLINVKAGSTDVTLSWIRFENHNRVMLFNNLVSENLFEFYDRDSQLRVTLHHSYFVNTIQRNPRAQIGTSHIYNNLLEDWDFYGMSFSLEHRSLIEGNIFSNRADRPCTESPGIDESFCKGIRGAPALAVLANGAADRAEYDKSNLKYHYTHDWRAFLKVRNNLFLGDAKAMLTDYQPEKVPPPPYCYSYEPADTALADRIRAGAGNLGRPMQEVKRTCPVGPTTEGKPAPGAATAKP